MEAGTPGQNRLPLRPMELGEILDYSFRLYKQTWKTLIPIGLVTALPYMVVQGTMQTNVRTPENSLIFRLMSRVEMGDFSGLAILGVVYAVVILAAVFLSPLVNGAFIAVCSRAYLGERTSAGQALRIASSRYWSLLGTGILFGLMMILAFPFLIIGGLVIFFFISVPAGYAALLTFFVFTSQAIVVEGTPGGIPAFKRSVALVRGRFWPLLGIGLVFGLMTGVLSSLISGVSVLPITIIQMFASGSPVWGWLSAILSGIGMAVMMPFSLIGKTLAYYDTRIRKEGFDLEMLANAGVNREQV